MILAIIGVNETAGSVDIRTRLKYSNISSVTASSRMGTIIVCVVEEGLNVRSRDILVKSIPAVMREKTTNIKIAAYHVSMHASLLSDSPTAMPFIARRDTMTSLARIPLNKDIATLALTSISLTEYVVGLNPIVTSAGHRTYG